MSDLKPETLEVPDRVRRQIEEMASRLEAAEKERDEWKRSYDSARFNANDPDQALVDRLEATESALTEALDALDDIVALGGRRYAGKLAILKAETTAARIRSQIEGSNDG